MNIREQYANVSQLFKTKNLESFENNFVPFLRWQGIPEIGFNSGFKKLKFYFKLLSSSLHPTSNVPDIRVPTINLQPQVGLEKFSLGKFP